MKQKRFRNFVEEEKQEKFKNSVYRKYNCNCAVPNCKGKHLTIHHKVPVSESPFLEFDLDNCVLLCEIHHRLIHNPAVLRVGKNKKKRK